jgi:hypothetical protein
LRLLTLILSITTLALFGRALAGLGGFLFGRGRIDYIVQGLLLGSLTTVAAFWTWKRYLKELDAEARSREERDDSSS